MTLLVEDDYQRRLTKRSITLTRKVAENFDWLRRRGGEDFISCNGSALGVSMAARTRVNLARSA